MEFVDIEQMMKDKLAECDDFLNGKDVAFARVSALREELAVAEEKLAEYDDVEYVNKVIAYRDDLKCKLGIVDVVEEVAEAHNEQVVECAVEQPTAPAEVATDEIVEQPLL